MKQVFRLSVAIIALILMGYAGSAFGQTPTPSVDPFIAQLSSSSQNSFAGGVSGDGRFIVIESTGDIGTKEPGLSLNPSNADGNREIFLVDFAQRRIFQITNTKSALKDANGSTTDRNNIRVEVSNNKPVISTDGRWIAFGSNATVSGTNLNPGNFDGNAQSAALTSDGNTEIFLYQVPATTPVDLASGIEAPFVNLSTGAFTRVTNTPASRPPQEGTANTSPFVADDNRNPSLNDNGSLVAFTSTRDIIPGHNAESIPNPEVFIYNRTGNSFTQVTETQGMFFFNENPTLSGPPPPANTVVSFISNANIPGSNNPENNAEIYFASFNGSAVTGITQVTRTTPSSATPIVNLMSPGSRRLTRNGNFITFESTANLAGDGAIQSGFAIFVYNIAANTFTQVGPRSQTGQTDLLIRFPTFTADNSTLIFTSTLNLDVNGAVASSGGLNPDRRVQLFSTPIPVSGTPVRLTRLTNTPANAVQGQITLQSFASNTQERVVFTLTGAELGGGNSDRSTEAFYLLARSGTNTTATVSFFTGASRRPVVSPSPAPTPPAVAGLAPGMLGIITSSVALAPSNQNATGASNRRTPPLPIELNGVSVSVNGAAAGLYFVGNSPSEIMFVVPIGLAPNSGATDTYPVVINNNGTIIRSTLRILPAQPDLFSTSGGAGGRAIIFNVTNPMFELAEPPGGFPVTTGGMPTVLRIVLTGVRGVAAANVTVRIGSTTLTGAAIKSVASRDMPGFDQIDVQLPSSAAHSCNVPVIVSVTVNGVTFTSRPADSAPVTSIGPCP
ncbi:MAG TPA: hypothetical protein VF708_03845 [Pyrinomonadaceae bacterium]